MNAPESRPAPAQLGTLAKIESVFPFCLRHRGRKQNDYLWDMGVGPLSPDPYEEMLAMDFDWSPRPMAPMFSDDAVVPGIEDDSTGAGSDFYVWDNILPESAGQAHNVPSLMSPQAPGIETSISLAARLHWRLVIAKAHSQTWLYYHGQPVPIDTDIAPVIEALWQAGYPTLACCEGDDTETESAYIMFAEPVAKQLMEWVQAHEQWLPWDLTRRFEIIRQEPNEWFPYMSKMYPLIAPVDCEGGLYTIAWRFHGQELLDHREQLVTLLRAK